MSKLNRVLNPDRMNFATRAKLSAARRGTGSGKTYTKSFGVHTHRIVAARMLGSSCFPEKWFTILTENSGITVLIT